MTRTPGYLPPERPFPPELRTELRARILNDLAAPAPHRGRALGPLAAAAAVLLVIALSLLLTRADSKTRIVPAEEPYLPVPGYTTQQLAKLVRECGAARYPGMRLYNVHKDATGLDVLFYGPDGSMQCGYNGYRAAEHPNVTPVPQGGLSGGPSSTWLEMPVQYDGGNALDGGDVNPSHAFPGREGYAKFFGRVASYVVRVELDVTGQSVTAPVVNGTFVITAFVSKDQLAPAEYQLFGYRKDGSTVRNPPQYDAKNAVKCVVAPNGTVVRGDPKKHPEGCLTAIRWEG